jgi:hypothetical protein
MDPRRSGLFLARSICRRCRTGYGRADFTSLAGNDDTLCLGADPGEHGTCLGSGQAPIARRSRRSGSGAINGRMFIRDVTLGLSFPKCVQYAHSGKVLSNVRDLETLDQILHQPRLDDKNNKNWQSLQLVNRERAIFRKCKTIK